MDPFTYQLPTLYFVYLFLSHVHVAGITFGSTLFLTKLLEVFFSFLLTNLNSEKISYKEQLDETVKDFSTLAKYLGFEFNLNYTTI